MIVSFSVLRMLIWFLSIGEPFLCHDTFALGLPCKKPGNSLYMILGKEKDGRENGFISHFPQMGSKNHPERN